MSTQPAIIWPSKFLPGTTDNFVSNETIAANLSASQIWPLLADITQWPTYYRNVSDITPPSSGPHLKQGDTFKFSTFGFPVLTCPVEESVPPKDGQAGRIAWSFALGEEVSGYHAWLVQDLEGGRVRILTQESQIGKPAVELRGKKPNRMLLGHQDWLDGLVAKARGEEIGETNLGVTEGRA
ncbi:uncharacterized protein LTR77_003326 [Saxophila tyrrhenica]|uniref:Uncharacterized protein n=1 Tax=Saxophila tyrrhenica TaxID=1690608 RepID=A0AAV9PH30_9PEZI|nr:hypothetical protein LTR77_003326 [Saxophila tyrrhenica]